MRMAGTDAARCGLHRTYYSGIERGVRNVSLVNIEKAISRSRLRIGKRMYSLFQRSSNIQTGAWSLALTSPRTQRSTPPSMSRSNISGESRK